MTTDTDLDDALAAMARHLDRDLDPGAGDRLLDDLLRRDIAAPIWSGRPAVAEEWTRPLRPRRFLVVGTIAASVVALLVGALLVVHRWDAQTAPPSGPIAPETPLASASAPVSSPSPTLHVTPPLPAGAGAGVRIPDDDIYAKRAQVDADLAAAGFRMGIRETPKITVPGVAEWTCPATVTAAPEVPGVVFDTETLPSGEVVHVFHPELLPPDVYLVLGVPRGGGNAGMITFDFVTGGLPACMPS